MAPLQPSSTTISAYTSHAPRSRSLQGRDNLDEKLGGRRPRPNPTERAASFHGRPTSTVAQAEHRPIRRPKTQPDLLAGTRRAAIAGAEKTLLKEEGIKHGWDGGSAVERRVPSKVLVNVTVQRSLLGPLQVMASTEWTVADLVAAAVQQYVKEGRRPALPTTDPSAFSLHYSQFSLEGLAPTEKLFGLGSRNFFLCLKPPLPASDAPAAAAAVASSSSSSSNTITNSCTKQAEKASKIGIPWLKFVDFFLF